MAVFAATDYYIVISGNTLSSYIQSAELPIDTDELDATAFGSTYRTKIGGLKQATLSLTWNQDFATSAVDATIAPLIGTVVSFEVRPTSGARSTTNPAYTGSVLIKDWAPVNAKVGDLAMVSVSWPTSGTVSRVTNP